SPHSLLFAPLVMVVSPIAAPRSPASALAQPEPGITTAVLHASSPASLRTAIDTLADAREEARLARAESATLRTRAADALKAAEETEAIASQAEAEVAAALDILQRAKRRADTRHRHVSSPIGAVATTPLPVADLDKEVVVYTDGSVIAGAHSAIGVFFGAGHPHNAGVALRANRHDAGLAELAAIQCALRLLLNNPETKNRPIVIRTDYKNVLNSSRHQSDRVFRAEYDRLRNLIKQFPRGVRYEHVESHRGAFGNNEACGGTMAHRLARDALRQSVQEANRAARSRTNSTASARATSRDSKASQRSTRTAYAPSRTASVSTASRSSSAASASARRTKSTAASTARSIVPISSMAASTARSVLPTATARSGATTANSSRSVSKKRPTVWTRNSASKSADNSSSASRGSASSKRTVAKKHPQTSVRIAKSSTATAPKKSVSFGSSNVPVSTAASIKSVRSKRGLPANKKSVKSTRTTSKASARSNAREEQGVTTALTISPRTTASKRSKRDISKKSSKKSGKSTRAKRPRTPAPKSKNSKDSAAKSAHKNTSTGATGSKQSTRSSRSIGRQNNVSRTQNTNSGSRGSASHHSGASGANGASRGASAGGRR
ncbi:hypothetical protein PENTCL1PPCAC_22030, partial [Pristionchus entomophagus]